MTINFCYTIQHKHLVTSVRHYPISDESNCKHKNAIGIYHRLTVLDSTHHKHSALYDFKDYNLDILTEQNFYECTNTSTLMAGTGLESV